MKIFGNGIDIIEVSRITDILTRHGEKFLAKIFTPAEQAYCDSHKHSELHYAARFAAKEAVAKAFGTGIGEHVGWLDLEVIRHESGAPSMLLCGNAAEFARENGITELHISLTHARDYAAATALAIVG